jgi:uncharacterized protein YqgC (DUF456 family)
MFLIWLGLVTLATLTGFTLAASESAKRIGWGKTACWFSVVVGFTIWNATCLLFTFLEHNPSWF